MPAAPSKPHATCLSRRRRDRIAGPMLCAALAAGGCSTQPAKPVPTTPQVIAAGSGPTHVPAIVARSLGSVVDQPPLAPGSSISLREIELSPDNSTRTLLARGQGTLCRDGNCALGLFDHSSGELKPVLLTLSVSEPVIRSDNHEGRQDLGLTSAESEDRLSIRRLQWSGTRYLEASCSVIDRQTRATTPCVRTSPEDVPVFEPASARLCASLLGFVHSPASNPADVPLIQDAFLIRRDGSANVQGLRVDSALNPDPPGVQPLLQCLRSKGVVFGPGSINEVGGYSTTRWVARAPQRVARSRRMVMSFTPMPDRAYAVLSIGMFIR